MAELLKENGWLGVTLILTLQFVYSILKDQFGKNRKLLIQIQKDVNMSFAFLRIMSGDKYPEIIKKVLDEKVLRE